MDRKLIYSALVVLLAASLIRAQVQQTVANSLAPAAAPSIALVNSVTAVGAGAGAITSSAVNMTGANLCVIVSSSNTNPPVPTSSPANTYVVAGTIAGGTPTIGIYYKYSPSVSSSMTVTTTGAFGSATLSCYSGSTGSTVDKITYTTNFSSATMISTASVTPTSNGEVLIEGLETPSAGSGFSVASPYTQTGMASLSGGTSFGFQSGYYIQPTSALTSATISWTGSSGGDNGIAAFK